VHGRRRWPFDEEGLCGQMVASGLADKVGDKKEKRKIFWSFYGCLPEKKGYAVKWWRVS
jgi:hypothetical protein